MSQSMKFGLYIQNYDAFGDIHTFIEFASRADKAGWDKIFIWDHIYPTRHKSTIIDPALL